MAHRIALLSWTGGLAALSTGCEEKGTPLTPTEVAPQSTTSSGSTSTLLGRATFEEAPRNFKVKRITGDWHVEVKAKPNLDLDLAVQRIVFQPGGQSGCTLTPARSSSRLCQAR